MGENGAGKAPDPYPCRAGTGRWRQHPAGRHTPHPRLPRSGHGGGLSFLHQELQIVPALDVAENMHLARPYPRRFGLVHWSALHRAAEMALRDLGVDHISTDTLMGSLGPGDQMLVRIAATLLPTDPAPWLYVMDEPTAALTDAEAARLFAAIAGSRRKGPPSSTSRTGWMR
jgi:ribose transport system ATP-binding protein